MLALVVMLALAHLVAPVLLVFIAHLVGLVHPVALFLRSLLVVMFPLVALVVK